MKDNFKEYFIPLYDIEFKEIPSLEDFKYNYVECDEIRIDDLLMEGASIITIYDAFHLDKDEKYGNSRNILFGPLLSQHLSTRSKLKCILKNKDSVNINLESLPHLKFITGSGLTFLTKEGKYSAMFGKEIPLEKVEHLEGIHFYGDWLLKLRVVIELLKRNVKNGLVQLDLSDYKNIAYKIISTEPALSKCENSVIKDAVNNWIPSMVSMPLIEDIPKKYIGKAKP